MKKQQDNFLHVSFFILFFLFFLEVEISTTDCACTSSTVIPFGLFELVLGCRVMLYFVMLNWEYCQYLNSDGQIKNTKVPVLGLEEVRFSSSPHPICICRACACACACVVLLSASSNYCNCNCKLVSI